MSELKYYTYAHYTADTKELFYIGKGIRERAWATLRRGNWWNNKVNKHGGRLVEILARWETEKEALEHEVFLIKTFRELGYTLVNITDGGQGISGVTRSTETREKLRKANIGKKHSKATKTLLSSRLKELKIMPSEEARKKATLKNNRKVVCVNTGVVYDSLKEASEKTGANRSHLSAVCQGKRKTTKGLTFSYVE